MDAVVIVGMGELGSSFARGFLKCGHTVVPVTRAVRMQDVAHDVPTPALVLVAVGEAELDGVLASLPLAWKDRVGLLQNELRPRSWRAHGIERPSVVVVWFEKKPTTLARELLPSVAGGPQAERLSAALRSLGLGCRSVESEAELEFELVAKNLYILTTNIAGLEVKGTVGTLFGTHRPLALAVANEVLALERSLSDIELSGPKLLLALEQAILADPEHACTGRSASTRLRRALALAAERGVAVPELRRIAESAT